MKKIITCLLLISLISCKKNDTGELHGIIKTYDEKPISNATVIINNSDIEITDQEGRYEFLKVNSGDYIVSAIIGFDTLIQYTTIYKNEINTLNFVINDPRINFVGTYKCLRYTVLQWQNIYVYDSAYIVVQYCDTAFNRINLALDGGSYSPYILDSILGYYYSNGRIINLDCYFNGKFYPDSINCIRYTDPDGDDFEKYWGNKVE